MQSMAPESKSRRAFRQQMAQSSSSFPQRYSCCLPTCRRLAQTNFPNGGHHG